MMTTKGMNRRRFLKIASVAAGTVATSGLIGCGSSDDDLITGSGNNPPPPPLSIVNGEAFYPQSVASGDPRPSSVILWTRVDAGGSDAPLRLQVATDESFANLIVDAQFTAPGSHDNCLKVRVTDLSSDNTYFYRFLFEAEGALQASRTGRTRTAPAADSTRTIRFGQVSCQDYLGRYYNTYLKLLEEDLDFVLHVGDYIYETSGDPAFQGGNPDRPVAFSNPDEAIQIGSGTSGFRAARSVGNYRDLYKLIRSDALMQQVHERFPMIAIWDDHEYSDDQWQASGTYTFGRQSEIDPERKRNAEQAYFEFMPIDTELDGTQESFFDEANRFPDTVIYRDFRFGANVQLLCTDYRTYRPDHLIPEDAFPGSVAVTEEVLSQILSAQGIPFSAVRDNFSPYVNVDQQPFASLKELLVGVAAAAYQGEGLDESAAAAKAQEVISGNLATTVINSLIDGFNATVPPSQQAPRLDEATIAQAKRGIAFFTMGKQGLFSRLGSRYFVVKETYDLYAAALATFEGPQTQNAFGQDQDIWLRGRLMNSDARWKMVANSVSNTALVLDLSDPALGVPAPFNQRFYLNVDQWDGFGLQRAEYLQNVYGPASGVVLLAGDIHASLVTDHGGGTVEFTTGAVSSQSLAGLVEVQANSDPVLRQLAASLLPFLGQILSGANPTIRHLNATDSGVTIIEAGSDELIGRVFTLPEDQAFIDRYEDPGVTGEMTEVVFRVDDAGLSRVS
ncbi:MAG: alkaline phosphatase D family protein [Xanthomonadales bacterium]|nr:alkaline phosphatase D family protein [Xanthomonadales bacterium]